MPTLPAPGRTRGVYILGNDVVLEYAIGLFRSLRHHSPDIPVRLLPYDNRLEKLRPWLERYRIDLHPDPDYGFYDRLGDELLERVHLGHHMFRKFAAFAGPYDDFLYLDADIAVLAPVEELLARFARSGAEFMTFDSDLDNVYRRTPWRAALEQSGRTKGFNAGAFLSRRGLFPRPRLTALLAEARLVRENFVFQYDQPFFNFAVDTTGLRQVRLAEFDPTCPDKQWGDQVPFIEHEGAWRLGTPGHRDYGKVQPFIHWAGHEAAERTPNRHVFYHYRLLGEAWPTRLAYRVADRFRWWVVQPARHLRIRVKETTDRWRIAFGRWRRRQPLAG